MLSGVNRRSPFLFETLTIFTGTVAASALEPAAGADATDASGGAELTLEPESIPLDPLPAP